MVDLTKELNMLLQVSEHIGFMEANSGRADEYKLLTLRDELAEMKAAFLSKLMDIDDDDSGMDINSSMIGVDDE
jgi:hypothetical protein